MLEYLAPFYVPFTPFIYLVNGFIRKTKIRALPNGDLVLLHTHYTTILVINYAKMYLPVNL